LGSCFHDGAIRLKNPAATVCGKSKTSQPNFGAEIFGPNPKRLTAAAAVAALSLAADAPASLACSRFTWLGPDQQVITGRSSEGETC
jgi:hypothetical protein